MTKQALVLSTAVSTLLALGALTISVSAVAGDDTEKCYGVAKAGENDCAANGHSCAGQAKTDNHPAEWKEVEKGKCAELGGSPTPPA